MAFFCAGSSGEAKKKAAKQGSKPTANPGKNAIGSISNGGGRLPQSASSSQTKQLVPSIPHSNSHDLPPNSRKMIVLQEYTPQDNRGLMVKRGESVQVISQDGNWLFVRNEWGKEGHVPNSHLVAPYSSMRSRSKSTSGTLSIRPVASGSSIASTDVDSSLTSRGVPMQVSQSAGRPRNHDDGRSRRVVSPPSLSQNDVIGTSMSQGNTPYEQKYSPSSSSGVASMNGPLSPSYTSLQPTASQEHVEQPRSTSGSSITQDQSSLSSMEEQPPSVETPPPMTNGHASSNEGMRTDRTQSETQLTRTKPCPQHSVKSKQSAPNVVSNETPPPVPPRTGHTSFTSNHGDHSVMEERLDVYVDPVDVVRHHQHQLPLSSNSLRRGQDGRVREVKRSKDNGEYTEVYQGGSRSRGINGHHRYHLSQETESNGSSSRRSSKKSSSTCKSYSRGRGEMYYDPIRLSLPDDDERDIDLLPPVMGQNQQTKIDKFRKFVWGVYIVTHEFEALDENEVSVCPGDHVSVFNQDDREWFWVVKHATAEEGFVPSCILEETSIPDNHSVTEVVPQVSEKPPPLPPKQPLHPTHGPSVYDHTQHFRQRAQSHDTRPAGIVRRPSPASGHRVRGRLNSDGSTPSSFRSSTKAPSITSMEKTDFRESPPPPYSEYDRHNLQPPVPPRHFSHSQQAEPSPAAYNVHSMHRTRSHGQVQFRRQGVTPLGRIERTGSDRMVTPDLGYQLRSPTTLTGGTLV